jgi:transposase
MSASIKRRQQIAAVAVARKLAVLCWNLLTKEADYLWARPALVAKKIRDMELASGEPVKKGSKPGPAYAYNVKALRNQEKTIAENAERAYEHLVGAWQPRQPEDAARERLKTARHER